MAASSSSKAPKSRVSSSSKDGKTSLRRRLSCAIREKSCPICLRHIHRRSAAVLPACMHVYCADCIRKWSQFKRKCPLCNSHFHSWFLRSSTAQFHEERLHNLDSVTKTSQVDASTRRHRAWSRNVEQSVNRQPLGLPWRRSFGGSRFIPYDPQRVLRWRASIYSQRLRAVPLPSNNCPEQMILTNTSVKERMKQRIEPWITRELQAILQDPDPSVIVHVATFLYMSSLEEKLKSSSECLAEDTFIEQLRPFLHDQTNMFWHELRCFAGCSFDMETYDSVVEYRHL